MSTTDMQPSVWQKMKPLPLLILVTAAFFVSDVARADIPLFSRSDYRFQIRSWKVGTTSSGKKKIEMVVTYDIPPNTRFCLHVAKEYTESFVDASVVAFVEVQNPAKGEVKIEFEDEASRLRYFVGLWRGWPREKSPSGVDCDGAFVDFTPTIISTVRYP